MAVSTVNIVVKENCHQVIDELSGTWGVVNLNLHKCFALRKDWKRGYIVHFYTCIINITIIIITITSNNQRLRSARDKILCIKVSHVDGQKYK